MKRALIFGAGNIGRGFLGSMFTRSGFAVAFADIKPDLVAQLAARSEYPIELVDGEDARTEWVRSIHAIDAWDASVLDEAVASADLMATAVGVKKLPEVASMLAPGLRRRLDGGVPPVSILVCENMIGANRLLRDETEKHLPDAYREALVEQIGFVEVTVGRVVPGAQDGAADPLLLLAEPYGKLPYDRTLWRGEPYDIVDAVACDRFEYQILFKLLLQNMGHAVAGYLGYLQGYVYIHEAVRDPAIREAMRGAMSESARALEKAFPKDAGDVWRNVDDLVMRYANPALMDPITRVCADPLRKLGPNDRLVGALKLCIQQGVPCPNILRGIAAALRFDPPGDEAAARMRASIKAEGAQAFLRSHCGIDNPAVLSDGVFADVG